MTCITLLKNQLRFSVTTAVCVFLLSACGSNSTPPVATDRLAFNAAVVAFDITTDPVTLTAAELAFTNFIAAYPTSSLVDDAYYYIARSVHERAKLAQSALDPATVATAAALFTEARSRYSDTTKIPPTSNKVDNAQLQIGKTYYDQTTLPGNYGLALDQFNFVLTNFPTSSIADDAQYYKGRTKHEQALLAQIAVSLTATTLFDDARFEYNKLLTLPTYALSTRRDDAQYQIGRTYYDLTLPNYTQAITEFDKVFANYNPLAAPASVGDDARYYLGRSKHEIALLPAPIYTLADALTEYNLVLSNYCTVGVPSARCDDAQYQVGKTHYDVAIPAATDYSTALGHFQAVIDLYGTTASASDNAQYYIGRSKHEIALLPAPIYTLGDAFAAYNLVLTSYCTAGVPISARCDDARYQVGRTYFDVTIPTATDYSTALGHFQAVIDLYGTTASAADDAQYYIGRSKHAQALLAQIAVNPDLIAVTELFTAARDAYNVLFTLAYNLSTRRDDAAFYSAMTFHDAEDCPNEKTAMTAFVANFSEAVSPIFNPDAQRHLNGVTSGGGGHNTPC